MNKHLVGSDCCHENIIIANAFGEEDSYLKCSKCHKPCNSYEYPPESAVNPVSVINKDNCTLPPQGWGCTRKAGHDGSCAASVTKPNTEIDLKMRIDLLLPSLCEDTCASITKVSENGHLAPCDCGGLDEVNDLADKLYSLMSQEIDCARKEEIEKQEEKFSEFNPYVSFCGKYFGDDNDRSDHIDNCAYCTDELAQINHTGKYEKDKKFTYICFKCNNKFVLVRELDTDKPLCNDCFEKFKKLNNPYDYQIFIHNIKQAEEDK